jgi:RNA polymerase sigma factor (TIGR02999 family)
MLLGMSDVTLILAQIEDGDPSASEQLLPLVYDELRKLAAAKLANEKPGQTLQPTSLVHEAYIRLVDVEKAQHWNSRGHFFAAAAEAMRRILVERARKRARREQIVGSQIPLDGLSSLKCFSDDQVLRLDEALDALDKRNRRAAEVAKLRIFAGLSVSQAAEALNLTLRTAERSWTYARVWLHRELDKSRC